MSMPPLVQVLLLIFVGVLVALLARCEFVASVVAGLSEPGPVTGYQIGAGLVPGRGEPGGEWMRDMGRG